MIYREFPQIKKTNKSGKKETKTTNNSKPVTPKFSIKPFEYDYNKSNKTYAKTLSFPTNDSAFAVLKVNNFSYGKYQKTYQSIFTHIKKYKVKNLVLDLRNNGGGKLSDANLLYSYLLHDEQQFLGSQIVNNPSAVQRTIVDIMPWYMKPLIYPLSFISYAITKENEFGEKYIKPSLSRVKLGNSDLIYHGNLYVLINGGSYSASALISSNLKANNRAYFVGEETGGDATGTVAGFMPTYKLPNSHLKLSIGTIYLQPKMADLFDKGKGVQPDFYIKPNLKDKQKNLDPELIWILNDCKNENKELYKIVRANGF